MRITRLITLLLGMLLVTVNAAMAGGLLPDIPAAQGRFSDAQGCVEPTAEMRRNHMKYILHQRDETVHEGIRDRQHSLNECINCHVSEAADAPRISSDKHFCSSCHSYAAVSIDCFQCHADRPVKDSSQLRSLSGGAALPALTTENLQTGIPGGNP